MAEKRNIDHQIAEVARECALRKNVYPGFVSRGKMRQGEADEHQARMEAALETLIWVRDNREALIAVSRVASEPQQEKQDADSQ